MQAHVRPYLKDAFTSLTLVAIAFVIAMLPELAHAQGFERINTTVTNVVAALVLISVGVVTIAIMWAGFKMIFHASRLSDVANILFGATLIGAAGVIAAYLVAA